MIWLSSREKNVDIAIVYTGLRPGEKLFEDLLGAQEGSEATEHPKIFRARTHREGTNSVLGESVDHMKTIRTNYRRREDIMKVMTTTVPAYKPDLGNGSLLNG